LWDVRRWRSQEEAFLTELLEELECRVDALLGVVNAVAAIVPWAAKEQARASRRT
jgi:hypothetical protein